MGKPYSKELDKISDTYEQANDTAQSGINIPLEIQTKGEEGLQYKAKFLRHKTWRKLSAIPTDSLIDAAGDWVLVTICEYREKEIR